MAESLWDHFRPDPRYPEGGIHGCVGDPPLTESDEAVKFALASVRLEGREPSPRAIELATLVSRGQITADEAVRQIIAHYQAED